jgi:predicted AlkP superfamily phosphohydrolase/phosphomutase
LHYKKRTEPIADRKSDRRRILFAAACVFFAALCLPAAAIAYIGPGAGFALVSSFLSFVIAFFAAFFAVLTYPVRMITRRLRRKRIPGTPRAKRVIILGLDGLDPDICELLMESGDLPAFSRLRSEGTFRRLATSTPAMSPVAWSSFSTGVDASRHAIFDFLARDARTYAPVLSSSRVDSSTGSVGIWRFRIPRRRASIRFLRKSRSFWKILSEYGIFSTIMRVPITFPPEEFNGVMLSGMCVPDLRGTMGSFTYFTRSASAEKIGGMVVRLPETGDTIKTSLPGPASPTTGETLELPIEIRIDRAARGARISISGETFFLGERRYSPWIRLTFKAAPFVKLHGIARFYITGLGDSSDSTSGEFSSGEGSSVGGDRRPGDSFGLYVSPIHIDPERPAMPISHPSFYSVYLAKRYGPFGTLGLAEDTWAVNEHVLDEEAFIEQAYLFHREREAMFLDAVKKTKRGLVTCVFDLSDRMQHIFFRYLVPRDDQNGLVTRRRESLYEMYREMDRLVAKTAAPVDDETALIVMSDHGFKAFERGVDINAWLVANGYLALKEGAAGAEYLRDVDWSKTKAYALGLGGIYINRKGRERFGTVEAADYEALKEEIKDKLLRLTDGAGGARAVSRIIDTARDFTGPYRGEGPDLIVGLGEGYRISWDCARGKITDTVIENNDRSWSGDHCIDPDLVPGVLFSNLRFDAPDPNIMDIAPTVLKLFGIDPPKYMMGTDLLEE